MCNISTLTEGHPKMYQKFCCILLGFHKVFIFSFLIEITKCYECIWDICTLLFALLFSGKYNGKDIQLSNCPTVVLFVYKASGERIIFYNHICIEYASICMNLPSEYNGKCNIKCNRIRAEVQLQTGSGRTMATVQLFATFPHTLSIQILLIRPIGRLARWSVGPSGPSSPSGPAQIITNLHFLHSG